MISYTTSPCIECPVWDVRCEPGSGPDRHTIDLYGPTQNQVVDLPLLQIVGLSRDDLIALRATLDAALNPLIAPILARGP